MRLKVMIGLAVAAASVLAPAAHAEDDAVGFSCGFSAFREGVTNPQSQNWTGEIDGGPWVVANPNTVSVTITCSLQANSSDPASGDLFTASAVTPGNTGALAQPLNYTAAPSTAIYLCSRIDWVSDQGAQSFTFDADDTVAGDQCSLATSA